jgi:hypothetical protein
VRDLESRRGVLVNGKRCRVGLLHPGDVLSIAKIPFEIRFSPPGDGPRPINCR